LLKQQVGVFGIGGGGGGAGDGVAPAIMKSKQLMKVSGGTVHSALTQAPGRHACTTLANSSATNFCVGLPTLLLSLQELPVFHSHRPTTFPDGQVKSFGTDHRALI